MALSGTGAPALAGLLGISEVGTTSSKIWDINTTTGVPSNPRLVSTAPDRAPLCIAYSPTGLLYGVSLGTPSDFPAGGKLFLIDPSSGAATLVATLTQFTDVEGDIAVDPTDGTLYGVDGVGALFAINTTTGVCTTVGTLPAADYSAIGFDSAGDLYAWDSFGPTLYKVNKTNAAILATVSLSPSPGGEIGGLAFDPATGTAYLGANAGSSARVSTVDPVLGTVTPIGPLTGMDGVWGLTFTPDAGSCISGLVAFYNFDDPGNRKHDASGNHIDAAYSAAIPVPGRCGTALRFKPNNNVQEFYAATTPALNITGEMSASAYVRIRGQQSTDYNPGCSEGTIFCKGGANWFQIERDNDRLVFQNEPSGHETAIGYYPFVLNQWTQVGFVRGPWTASGQSITFYVNCQPIPTVVYEDGVSTAANILHTPAFASPDIFMVGNYGFGSDPGACEFNGDIDELKIFNKALQPLAMLALCSCPCPPPDSSCGDPTTLVIDTGWDAVTHSPIPIGDPDPEWMLVADPDIMNHTPRPTLVVSGNPDPLGPLWAAPQPSSRWVSSHAVAPVLTEHGLYTFEYRFCLEDTIGASLNATLREWVQINTYLNGTMIPPSIFNTALPSQFPATLSITNTALFRTGENRLQVVLENYNDPVALDLVGTVVGHFPASRACCSDSTSVLLGSVWADDDGDGVRDSGEVPLAGWTVHLSGTTIRSTTSDADGHYYFTGLPAGAYTIDQPLPPSWAATFPPFLSPAPYGHYSVFLDAGEGLGALDFGRSQVAGVGPPDGARRLTISVLPNPAAGRTTIAFTTLARGSVGVHIYDVGGREVADLSPGVLPAGAHAVAWDGRTAAGVEAPVGVYLVQIRAAGGTTTARMIRIR